MVSDKVVTDADFAFTQALNVLPVGFLAVQTDFEKRLASCCRCLLSERFVELLLIGAVLFFTLVG